MKKGTISLTLGALIHPSELIKKADPLLSDSIAATLIFGIGFAPITALALALMGICTLSFATLIIVIPALLIALALSCYHRGSGKLMLRGYLMGIIAVACYDCVRIPFTMVGWMDDFIPKIGGMLMGDENPHAIIGYLWRYLGNGGGMGMAFVCAFTLLRHRFSMLNLLGGLKSALLFGSAVWACLILTLKISPQGEDMMFTITPTSLLLSLIGHLVFGCALGCLVMRYESKKFCTKNNDPFTDKISHLLNER
jgi:hypothetical protein